MNSVDLDQTQYISSRLGKPIVLIGMMGCGKTRTGRMLAKALNLPFYDSDDEIIQAAGMDVAEIFERFGEDYFRSGEHRVIKRLLEQGTCVIATGGGAITHAETVSLIKEHALSIWIRADMSVMLERTGRTEKRPLLLQGDPEVILTELLEARQSIYETADVTVESHGGPAQAVLNQALGKIEEFINQETTKN